MTRDRFEQSTGVHRWWASIVEDENWQYIKEEAMRRRRFGEYSDQPTDYLEHKSHGYKDGFLHAIYEIERIAEIRAEHITIDEDLQRFEQDEDLPDAVAGRFKE